ncbi:MAG: Fe2+-dependent dioxygenase [Myxococcales bacterium]|nr:Fe2+-dependent dioxygenase [Myxococcales bacterium]
MFLVVDDLLSSAEAQQCRQAVLTLPFDEGRQTAGRFGQTSKRNGQLRADTFDEGRKELLDRMMTHPEVSVRVRPGRALAPVINRYEVGDGYDWHTDNPIQSGIRADISYTLFLSEPDNYDGGELVVRTPDGERVFKLAAGSAVFYDSAALHRVQPITRGQRLAAIGWVQSMFREPRDRELMATLRRAIEQVEALEDQRELFLSLCSVEAELGRRWVQPG